MLRELLERAFDDTARTYRCGQCQTHFDVEASEPTETRPSCPNCGSEQVESASF